VTRLSAGSIKQQARELGFDACGIAPAADLPELRFLGEWLGKGYAGTMSYLARSAARRADVRHVLPSARTVIATAINYNTDRQYSTECRDPRRAHIARYAWGDDYHDVVLTRLEALLTWMRATSPEPFEARAYVDTGPVQERVYAQHAGIGWIGKNTCVINEQLGSWTFLGEIISSLPLDVDLPASDQCGTHVYGCDICQEVCPWNAVAPASRDPAWQPRPVWDRADVETLVEMSDQEIGGALQGSAMRRAGVSGLRRNLAVALEGSRRA
jgi:epoxyqueuosine reductase